MDETNKQVLQNSGTGFASEPQQVFPQAIGMPGGVAANLPPISPIAEEEKERQIREKMRQGLITITGQPGTPLGLKVVEEKGTPGQSATAASDYAIHYAYTKGWGERNLAYLTRQQEFAKGDTSRFIKTGAEDSWFQDLPDWWNGFTDGMSRTLGFKAWEGDVITEEEQLKRDIAKHDEAFVAVKWDRLAEWQKLNPDVADFMSRTGTDLTKRVMAANNEKAFALAITESALEATLSHRMNLYQEMYNPAWRFADQAWESFKDPLIVRDFALTTGLTFGLGTIASGVRGVATVGTAAAATGAIAAEQSVARLGMTATQRAAQWLLMRTGPTIGLIEGPTYMALKGSLLPLAGEKFGQTLAARGLAMATEGFVAGTVSALAEQKAAYDWRKLTINDLDKAFAYDYKEAITTGAVSGLGAMLMLGTMRFGLGVIGDRVHLREWWRTGDSTNYRRAIANSLDTWATTKEGRVVWGETLSDGRGIFFGDWIDGVLKKNDGRDFASIMVNGSRLFGKLDSRIAAKMNLDLKEATKVAEAFEAATGIAGEAAMRQLGDIDPAAGAFLVKILNKEWLKSNGLDYDTVANLMNEYAQSRTKSRMGPSENTAATRLMDNLSESSNHAKNMHMLVHLKMMESRMLSSGLDPRAIIDETEAMLGKKLSFEDEVDFKSYRTVALAKAGDAAEEKAFGFLNHVFNGADDELISVDGRIMPRNVARSIVRKMMGSDLDARPDEIRWFHDGGESTDTATYIIGYDPKTNEVFKTKRTIEKGSETLKDGTTRDRINQKFSAEEQPSFKNTDNRISTSQFRARMEEVGPELDAAFNATVKSKISELTTAGKITPEKELELQKFEDGVALTPEVIRNMVDNIGVADSHAMSVILTVLGYDAKQGLLRIIRGTDANIERGARGNIILQAGKALIQARRSADIGTLAHETSHYNRYMFLNESGLADRAALGISDGDWVKFLEWVGNKDNIWSTDTKFAELEKLAKAGDKDAATKIKEILRAEEKFANGWTTFLKNVMKGNGRAPSTAIQRLLHRLGDHMGDLDKKFASQDAMLRGIAPEKQASARAEMGLEINEFAETVFAKLANRHADKLDVMFDTAYRSHFSKLPDHVREAVGEEILGLAAWTDYKAKLQKSIAVDRTHTDLTVASSSVPKTSKTAVEARISEAVAEAKAPSLVPTSELRALDLADLDAERFGKMGEADSADPEMRAMLAELRAERAVADLPEEMDVGNGFVARVEAKGDGADGNMWFAFRVTRSSDGADGGTITFGYDKSNDLFRPFFAKSGDTTYNAASLNDVASAKGIYQNVLTELRKTMRIGSQGADELGGSNAKALKVWQKMGAEVKEVTPSKEYPTTSTYVLERTTSPAETTAKGPSLEGGKIMDGLTEESRAVPEEPSPFVTAEGYQVELNETEATVAVVRAVQNVEVKLNEAAATKALGANTLDEMLNLDSPSASLDNPAIKVVAEKPINLEEPKPQVRIEQLVNIAVKRMDEAREVTSELTERERMELTLLASGIRANPDRSAELVQMWIAAGEGRKAPRPSIEYLEAELRYTIARETVDSVTGLNDAELRTFLGIRERMRGVEDMTTEQKAGISSNPDDIAAFAKEAGIPVKDAEIYFKGMKQINDQMDTAELKKAQRYVVEHEPAQESIVKFLEDNEARYAAARDTGSDAEFKKAYEAKMALRSRFVNAETRAKLGRIPDEIVEVETVKAIEGGVWKLEEFETYQHLYKLFSKLDDGDVSVDIHDVLVQIGRNENTINTIAARLGYADSPDKLEVVKAFFSGKKSFQGQPWDLASAKAANAYIKGVIKQMTKTVKRKQLGTKKSIASMDIDAGKGKIDVSSERLLQRVERGTHINNESELLTYTAGYFYDRLIESGDVEVAEYFAARRATYWLPGNREDNLHTAYSRRFPETTLTAEKIASLEKTLSRRMTAFGKELADAGMDAEGIRQIVKGRLNTADTTKVLNQQALDVINVLQDPSDKATVRAAVEQFLNDPTHHAHTREVLSGIAFGEIKNGLDLWNAAFRNKGFNLHPLMAKYIKGFEKLDNFDSTMKEISVFGLRGFSGGMYCPQSHAVAFSLDRGTQGIQIFLHELIHALTISIVRNEFTDILPEADYLGLQIAEGELYLDLAREAARDRLDTWGGFLLNAYVNALDRRPDMIKYANDPATFIEDMQQGLVDDNDYGLTDIYEFFAEVMSNPGFIERNIMSPELGIEVGGKLAFPVDNPQAELLKPIFELMRPNEPQLKETLEQATETNESQLAYMAASAVIAHFKADFKYDLSTIKTWMEGNTDTDFIRVRPDGTIDTVQDFLAAGVDPRLAKTVLGQKALIDQGPAEQIKLRADLSAAKGRVFEARRVLSQGVMTIEAEDWKVTGKGAGSNPAVILEDLKGTKWYLKSAKSIDHAANEVIAQEMYHALGISVVRSFLVTQGEFGLSGPMLLSKWKTGLTGKIDTMQAIPQAAKDTFIASAWLANWDILGLDASNLDASGTVMDTGGSLMFRAQGQPKGDKFGNTVGELESLLDPNLNPTAHAVFYSLTDAEKIAQAKKLKNTMDDGTIALVVNAHGSEMSAVVRQQLIDKLIARRDYIYDKLVPEKAIEQQAVTTQLTLAEQFEATKTLVVQTILDQHVMKSALMGKSKNFKFMASDIASLAVKNFVDEELHLNAADYPATHIGQKEFFTKFVIQDMLASFTEPELARIRRVFTIQSSELKKFDDVLSMITYARDLFATEKQASMVEAINYTEPKYVEYATMTRNPMHTDISQKYVPIINKLLGPDDKMIRLKLDGTPTERADLTFYNVSLKDYMNIMCQIAEEVHGVDAVSALETLANHAGFADGELFKQLGYDPTSHAFALTAVLREGISSFNPNGTDPISLYPFVHKLASNQPSGIHTDSQLPIDHEVMKYLESIATKDDEPQVKPTASTESSQGKIEWNTDDLFSAEQKVHANSPNGSYEQTKYGIGDMKFSNYTTMSKNAASKSVLDVSGSPHYELMKKFEETLDDNQIYVNHKGVATDKGPNGQPSLSGGMDFTRFMVHVAEYWPEIVPTVKALVESNAKFDNGNRAFELICRLGSSKYSDAKIKDLVMSQYGMKVEGGGTAAPNMYTHPESVNPVAETIHSAVLGSFTMDKASPAFKTSMAEMEYVLSETVASDIANVHLFRERGVFAWEQDSMNYQWEFERTGMNTNPQFVEKFLGRTADSVAANLLGHYSGSIRIFSELAKQGVKLRNPMEAAFIIAWLHSMKVPYHNMEQGVKLQLLGEQLAIDITRRDTKLTHRNSDLDTDFAFARIEVEEWQKNKIANGQLKLISEPSHIGDTVFTMADAQLFQEQALKLGLDPAQNVSYGMSHGIPLWMAMASLSGYEGNAGFGTVATLMIDNGVKVKNYREFIEVASFILSSDDEEQFVINAAKATLAIRRKIENNTHVPKKGQGVQDPKFREARQKFFKKYVEDEDLRGPWTEDKLFEMQSIFTKTTWGSIPEVVGELRTWMQALHLQGRERSVAFKVLANIRKHVLKGDAKFIGDPVKFNEFFTDASGKNIMYKDAYGIPVMFHRGISESTATELVDQINGDKFRWWGESYEVARDYGSGAILSGYLKVSDENLLVLDIKRTPSWTDIKWSDIEESVTKFFTPEELEKFKAKLLQSAFVSSLDQVTVHCDMIADVVMASGSRIERVHAIKFNNLIDLTREGTRYVPHAQWAIRQDLNIMKSPEAIDFDPTPGQMRILNQKRIESDVRTKIAEAKSLGKPTEKLEKELADLEASADVRRRNLREKGFDEEVEPDDMKAIRNSIHGNSGLTEVGTSIYMERFPGMKPMADTAATKARIAGKNYRDLNDDERRLFVTDIMMPKIQEIMGNRNSSAGLFSTMTDSKVGRGLNSFVGGSVRYGETADSSSIALQFLSKILDPNMDLRDGEVSGVFDLFSVDLINAEKNNMYSRSGLLAIRNKILAVVGTPEELQAVNDTAWKYLADIEKLPDDVPNKGLVVELINAVHKYNELTGETLGRSGLLDGPMDPGKYGTVRRVNELAWTDANGFAEALTKHVLKRTRESGELSIITADALGWCDIKRATDGSDKIVSVTVKEGSPLSRFLEPKEYDWHDSAFQKALHVRNLTDSERVILDRGLESSADYKESWKKMYAHRGDSYSAIRRDMHIARDRYIGSDTGESKTGKPRHENVGGGRNFSEERILSHSEVAMNPELSKYFQTDIFDLINQQLNSSYTDALMTDHIHRLFGTRMSWLDMVHVLRKYGEETMDRRHMSSKDLKRRAEGYQRMIDVWEYHTGKMMSGKDGLDRYYETLLGHMRTPILLMGGARAATASIPEIGRALLASNMHQPYVLQLPQNLWFLLKNAVGFERRQRIKEIASASHWVRGLTADHLLGRHEVNVTNPFSGVTLGARQPGIMARFVNDWRRVGVANQVETNQLAKFLNYVGPIASRLGYPLAWVNDLSVTMHIANAQKNFTENSASFLKLAEMLRDGRQVTSHHELRRLAKECGLGEREAVALSTAGLLDPDRLRLIVEMAKDQSLYSDGLLDSQKMFAAAGDDQMKIDAINRMGSFINQTVRNTNTEPTLLDLRVNQSPYAKAIDIFMQFVVSHSIQEIGKRRRSSTKLYGTHLAGLALMEIMVNSVIRRGLRSDREEREIANEDWMDFAARTASTMPLFGSYGWISRLMFEIYAQTKKELDSGMGRPKDINVPDVFGGPADTIGNQTYQRSLDMMKGLLGQ